MKKSSMWSLISAVIYGVMLISEVALGVLVLRLGMLPAKLLILVFILLALGAVIPGLLMFWKMKKRKGAKGHACRIIAYILAVVIFVVCLLGSFVIAKLNGTLSWITDTTKVEATFGVYVLADDPAQYIDDAAEYTFAVSDSDDDEHTENAIAEIESRIGRTLVTENYKTNFAMIDALYTNEVGAILLNRAFIDMIEELTGYEDFSERTKLLGEYTVEKENTPQSGTAAIEITKDPFVVYLSGSDTRSTTLTTSNSDVNILAVVNPTTKQVLLINTPRDYYVANPAGNGALDKLTHCGIYGIQCSMEALAQLYDVQISYYGQINFTGFETLIDAIGGVTISSDVAFTTQDGYWIQKGENNLNGAQALSFARERYALAGGDNDRGKNQMKVIAAVIEQISAGKIISNYSEIMDSLKGMFLTNFTTDEISKLVKMQISEMPTWNVISYAVSGTGDSQITYSVPGQSLYVTKPDQATVDQASSLIDRVMAGEVLTADDIK